MTLVRDLRRRLGILIALVTIGIILIYYFINLETPIRRLLPVMPLSTSRPRVVLRQGTIVGKTITKSGANIFPQTLDSFLGVPYALSTAGEQRWKPALPIGPGEKNFDAGELGDRCPAGLRDAVPMSEDCLNLNLYRPSSWPKDKKLPVLVYFHGGSFNFGAGYMREISSLVAWSERPMLGISFNYRIGAFGFLSSKLVKEEGGLNVGLKDQDLLLRWVRDNVLAFGGDPNDVTLMGSSAGAHSVRSMFLLLPILRRFRWLDRAFGHVSSVGVSFSYE